MRQQQTAASSSPTPKPKPIPKHLSEVRRAVSLSYWESVKEERQKWLQPFKELPLDRAQAYLEDLRKVCEQAAYILNERIGSDVALQVCGGPHCRSGVGGKRANLSGLTPNGRPKWIAKFDYRDRKDPAIMRAVYFCSSICQQEYARKHNGSLGGDGR
jgi:hypothetical protein